jgi:PPP family 3-phenylpropionic acid transporter
MRPTQAAGLTVGARLGALPRFIIFYSLLYAAFGAASPFLPAFLAQRGVQAEEIGLLVAASTAIRLISGPIAGRMADAFHAVRLVLCVCTGAASIAALCYLPAHGFWPLLGICLVHAAMLAPTTTLSDALAVSAAARRDAGQGFEYGFVRGAGSAAFIVGSLIAGQLVGGLGLSAIIGLHALALAAAVMGALIIPDVLKGARGPSQTIETAKLRTLLQSPSFVRLVLIAALVLGSHAMHDSFAVIRWTAAGMSASAASVLWSEAVAAEVIVFFALGPRLLNRLGPSGALALACLAGVLRWAVMGSTANIAAMATMQPLHGFTFALLHLACMSLIVARVPPELAATAQALYGTLGVGLASVVLTLFSGWAYGQFGARGFWAMAAVCALALPLIWSLWRGEVAKAEPTTR